FTLPGALGARPARITKGKSSDQPPSTPSTPRFRFFGSAFRAERDDRWDAELFQGEPEQLLGVGRRQLAGALGFPQRGPRLLRTLHVACLAARAPEADLRRAQAGGEL